MDARDAASNGCASCLLPTTNIDARFVSPVRRNRADAIAAAPFAWPKCSPTQARPRAELGSLGTQGKERIMTKVLRTLQCAAVIAFAASSFIACSAAEGEDLGGVDQAVSPATFTTT